MSSDKAIFFGNFRGFMGGQKKISLIIKNNIKFYKYINISIFTINDLFFFFKNLFFQSLCKRKEYDLIYLNVSRSFLGYFKDLLIFFFNFNKKKIIHIHGNEHLNNPRAFITFLSVITYRLSDLMICVNKQQYEFYNSRKIRCHLLRNCFDYELINFDFKKIPNNHKRINVMFFSNLIFEKGIFNFLDLVEKIKIEDTYLNNFQFLIIGKNLLSKKDSMKFNQIMNSLIKNNVSISYHENLPRKKILSYLATNDIFIFPSFYKTESFGLVLLEAQFFNNYIIANHLPFMSDVLFKNNTLVDTSNIDLMYQLLVDYVHEPKKIKSKNFILDNFHPNSYLDEIKNYIMKI